MHKVLAVVFSDLHLEIWKQHNENNRRLDNAKDVLKKIALISKKYKAISLFAGDLYHKERALTNNILAETLPFFKKIWGPGKLRTLAITGNHDQSEQNTLNKQSPSYIKTLSQVFDGLECIDFKSEKIEDDIIIHGVPYLTHDLGLVDYINKIDIKLAYQNILMLHTTLPNTKDTDGRDIHSNLKDTEFYNALKRFDLVICGHVHAPIAFDLDLSCKVIQVGAPQQQRLTDKNCDMGYWLIYDDLETEFIPFKSYPKFVEIDDLKQKVDTKNFYVLKKVRKERISSIQKVRNFDPIQNKVRLAKNYLKQKGIDSKEKKTALIQILKSTE